MPKNLFGVDINRLSNSHIDRPRPGKLSPTVSVTELAKPMENIKRPTLAKRMLTDSRSRSQSKERSVSKDKHAKEQHRPALQQKQVQLGIVVESPPILFIGSPTQSTGALISGRLQITPLATESIVETISMSLECATTTKRPVQDRCRECMTHVTDLYSWNFLNKPKVVAKQDGVQEMPFSHMIPGHIPVTTHGQIGGIDYCLHVKARTGDGQEVEFRRDLVVRRALVPGPEKHSVRIFPPTTLQLQVTLPSIIHPLGEFPVECKMTGIVVKRDETQIQWRLRKLTWRIEEVESMISPACTKHANKVGGQGKGVQHEQSREVGWEELKDGWKTDMANGAVEGEFHAFLNSTAKPNCGMDAPNGLKISHNLILELVIAEEWSTMRKPSSATPTGAARVLRTQFALNVTERAGMGLAWDDEMPPSYEDVPDSPPHYQTERTTIVEYEGDDIHEDVAQLNLNS